MRSKRWWIALALLPVLGALALPFVLRRTERYFTDGARLREPVEAAGAALREVLWDAPQPLAEPIDLPAVDEYEPRVSPGGDLLVFTRGRPGENADLWASSRERARWADPVPLAEINSPHDELGACFSPQGEVLLFYSN